MVQDWFANNIFTYIVLGIFAAGILVKFLISVKYRTLIRASKRMQTSKNKLMRVLRLKFEACYKIKLGVNNVDTFVDKHVYAHRFCGIKLYTWETISGEFDILCALCATVFAALGAFYKCGRNDILFTLAVGMLGSALLITVDYFANIRMKRVVLRTNIKDYLENFLKARLESGEFSAEVLEQYKKEYLDVPQNKKEGNDNKKQRAQIAATKSEVEAAKQKKKEIDVGLRRREAKKRELKELIAADKKKDMLKEVSGEKKEERRKGSSKDDGAKEEIAASAHVQVISPYSRNAVKLREKKPEPTVVITEEEGKVIEDILKEYLS